MTTFSQDVRYACRSFKKSPAFTLTAILMLAFGIAATTSIFSVVYGMLLRPLPFPQADRLVTLGDQAPDSELNPVTAPEVLTYQRDLHSFSILGGYTYWSYELSGVEQPAMALAARMMPSMFGALGVEPLMGRVFTEQEDAQHAHVAVLSYRTWKLRFNGNPSVLGTNILLDREPYIVIAVMPKGFEFPLLGTRDYRAELWVPMSFSPEELKQEVKADGSQDFLMVGRLKPGVTASQAEADADRVAQQIMRNQPPKLANIRIRPVVHPLQQVTVQYERSVLRLLFWPVAIVMLIACVNFAGLLLVRAIRRQREMAVRLALGAPTGTLLWQIIAESLVLSAAGGLIGIGLAALAIYAERNYLGQYLLPENGPLSGQITLNWAVAGFAVLLAILTGIVCGLVPGFAALRTNVNLQMNEGDRSGTASAGHTRLRSVLVVLEIGVALVLLAASGLLLHSFQKMTKVDLGFQPHHVAAAEYALPQKQYSTQAVVDTFNQEVLERLRQLPGVRYATLASTIPMTGGYTSNVVVDGYVDSRESTSAERVQAMGDFFEAMGIPLLRGRYLTDADNANSELVVIVNHEFAEHYWPHQDPIGKRIRLGTLKVPTPWMTVVGEVADTKFTWRTDSTRRFAAFYTPVAQAEQDQGPLGEARKGRLNGNSGFIAARSALPAEQMENSIRTVVRELDPQLPLTLRTMDEAVSGGERLLRFNSAVVTSFALAAVLLAGLGIYSIVAFSVASRAHEMAIRIALGSQTGHIQRLVLASGAKLAAIGAAIGVVGTIATAKIVRGFLFEVSPFDPAVLVLASIAVFALALVASTIPARRAAAVDPMEALRSE